MSPWRVVVTGLGAITALGPDCASLRQGLLEGRNGIAPITSISTDSLKFKHGAEVRGLDLAVRFDPKTVQMLDRFAQLLLIAAREAVADAHLVIDSESALSTAVVTGSCLGGQITQDDTYHALYAEQRPRLPPLAIPRTMANAGASHVSMELGITGPVFTLTTACSSSSHALGLAFWMVRQGMAERAIAGGSEAPFCFGNLKAWEGLRTIAPDTCRPFSKDRRGMILGEGGAVLVLETLEAALARGARIHAELVGFGMSSDAHHITQPSAEGAAHALRAALSDAHLEPEDVDYVNAHGTGTLANDATETRALRQVFGTHADRLAVSSSKSMHGHTLGAAGAVEAVVTVLALSGGFLPPTISFTEPDPECDLDVVPNAARYIAPRCALSSSFAFGGLNAVLAFRRWDG